MRWNHERFFVPKRKPIHDLRQEMTDQTSAFLTEALTTNANLPRIPIRPASQGGFSHLLSTESGQKLILNWWIQALDTPQ
jgi:hypothetical protein